MWLPPDFWRLKNLEVVYTSVTFPIQVIKLEVLKNLVKLRVPISICDLQNIISIDDARKAELKNKNRIGTLHLLWHKRNDSELDGLHLQVVKPNHYRSNGVAMEDTENDEEAVLENLCPHVDIQVLKICDYPGVRYPRWLTVDISSFIKLTKITLIRCRTPCFPSFCELPLLKYLWIEACHVRSIENFYCFNNNLHNNNVTRKAVFPALTEMYLYFLRTWEVWCGMLDGVFPKLQFLEISGCVSLVKLPNVQSAAAFVLESNLQQHRCSNVQATYPSWTSNVSFTLLTNITLMDCNVTCIPTLDQLPILKYLCIKSCPVKIIGPEFCWSDTEATRKAAFPAITKLELNYLEKLEEWCGILDSDFPKLKSLTVSHCYKLGRIPCLPPALVNCTLDSCSELESLSLTSNTVGSSRLEQLKLLNCHKLRSLLGLSNLTCQQVKLKVANCDFLMLQDIEHRFKIASEKLDFSNTNGA